MKDAVCFEKTGPLGTAQRVQYTMPLRVGACSQPRSDARAVIAGLHWLLKSSEAGAARRRPLERDEGRSGVLVEGWRGIGGRCGVLLRDAEGLA